MADIATLTVRITAALGDFAQKMDEFGRKSDAAFGKLAGSTSILNIALGNLAAQGMAAAISGAKQAVTEFFDFADQLVKLEAKTGIAIETLQELKFAADQSAVPFETLTRAVTDLQVELSKGTGTPFAKAIDLLGLSFEGLQQLKPEDQLQAILDATGEFGNRADQVAILAAAFGQKLGPELVPLIGQMGALREEAQRLGIVLSEDDVRAAETFGDSMDALTAKVKASIVQGLIPFIETIGDLKGHFDTAKAGLDTFTAASQEFQKAGIRSRIVLLQWGVALAKVANLVPGSGFTALPEALDVLSASLEDSKKELDDFGRTVRTTDISLPTPKPPGKIVPAGYFATAKKEVQEGLKLLTDAFDEWGANVAKTALDVTPTFHAVDLEVIFTDPVGTEARVKKELLEQVKEWFDLRGRGAEVALLLPPPTIEMAPADVEGIGKELADKQIDATIKRWQERGAEVAQAAIGAIQAGSGAKGIGGAIGGTIGKQIGTELGPKLATVATKAISGVVGKAAGAAIGGALGSVVPVVGTILGSLAGSWIGGLFGPSQTSQVKKMREELLATAGGLDALKAQAAGSAEAMAALAKLQSATKVKDFEKAQADLTAALKKQDDQLKKLAASLQTVTDSGGLLGTDLMKQIAGIDPAGAGAGAVFEFFKAQTQKAAAGLEAFVTNAKISSQAAATAATGAIGAIFADLQLQGATAGQALAALAPSIAALQAQLTATKFTGSEAFGQLSTMAQFASDKVSGPLFTAIGGLGDLMVGLNNTGVLTQEMFTGLAGQVADTWQELVNMGKGGAAGMALIQRPLQKVWELTVDHGYAVDEATQKLLDEGVAAGIVGDQFRDAGDQMRLAIETLVDRLDQLITVLTTSMPAGAQTGAQGVQDALDSIETPTITIPIHFDVDPFPDIPTFSPDVQGSALTVNAQVNLDGEVLARSAARNMGRVLAPYGVE